MKIAVLEHFTALPAGAARAGPRAEGRAMRDAVVSDLRDLPGLSVEVVGRFRAFRGKAFTGGRSWERDALSDFGDRSYPSPWARFQVTSPRKSSL